jgi:molybdopterin-guanine dinucleotide biosynthesis protein A
MNENLWGVVLAGGRARRMNGIDKPLALLDNRPLLTHVLARAMPQLREVALVADDGGRLAPFGLPIVSDAVGGLAGPLAAIAAGLDWAKTRATEDGWLASFPCDTPFFPRDLVARLLTGAQEAGADIAIASSGGRIHPVFGLWRMSCAPAVHTLLGEGVRKMKDAIGRFSYASVDFEAESPDPFFNINTPEDLAQAEAWIKPDA